MKQAPDDTSALLKYVANYIDLDPEEEAYFLSKIVRASFDKGEYLLKIGEVCKYMAFVVEGCLRKCYIDAEGNEVVYQFMTEDWWFSDMASFTSDEPSELFIQALEPCKLLFFSKDSMEDLYKKIPKFETMFRIMTQKHCTALQSRFINAMTLTAEERYYQLIEKYPQLLQRVAQRHIATYLGITPSFLSVIRKKLVQKG